MKKEIIFGGVVMRDYYIEKTKDGVRLLSYKRKSVCEMSIPKSGKAKYPKVKFRVQGRKITADIHRVIAENLLTFPRPKNIPVSDWQYTPDVVKEHIKSLYFVNHKDHDKYNCSLDNLEWVTSKGNARAFQRHRRSQV